MSDVVQWAVFLGLAGVALVTAAGMLLTMSMYRAGLALMSCFVAVAGLFILLDADLLAVIQVMMNVGGMLVMILFMVMIMPDPGGEMMWEMKRQMHLPGLGALSMRMPSAPPARPPPATTPAAPGYTCPMHPEVQQQQPGQCPICGMGLIPIGAEATPSEESVVYTCPMHPEVRQAQPGECPRCGMPLVPVEPDRWSFEPSGGHGGGHPGREVRGPGREATAPHAGHAGPHPEEHLAMTPWQHYQMMVEMAMSTAQLPWAVAVGVASALALGALVVTAPWPLATGGPSGDAVSAVGELLLSRYMIGFEGAAFLILAGMAGAVILGKREPAVAPRRAAGVPGAALSTCPMHPEIQQPGPGQCPICGMPLVPLGQRPARSHPSHEGYP